MPAPADKPLPTAIPSKDLEALLGPSQSFCSWDATASELPESHDCWPYLFSAAARPPEKPAK